MKLVSLTIIGLAAVTMAMPKSNSQMKHEKALAEKADIIAEKKARAQAKADRFNDAKEAHEATANAKKDRFEAAKAQHEANAAAKQNAFNTNKAAKEAAKAAKENAESLEAAQVKANKDAKQAVKDAKHQYKLDRAQAQKAAFEDNHDVKVDAKNSKKIASLKQQLKTCNRTLWKFNKFSGSNHADFGDAHLDGADGLAQCMVWLSNWELLTNNEIEWNYQW